MLKITAITDKGVQEIEFNYDFNNVLYVDMIGFSSYFELADELTNKVDSDAIDKLAIISLKQKAVKEIFKDDLEGINFNNEYFFNELIETLYTIVKTDIENYAKKMTNVIEPVIIEGVEYSISKVMNGAEFVESQFIAGLNTIEEKDDIKTVAKKTILLGSQIFALLFREKGSVLPVSEPEKMRDFLNERSKFWLKHGKYKDIIAVQSFFLSKGKNLKRIIQ